MLLLVKVGFQEAAFENLSVPCPLPNDLDTYIDDTLVSSNTFESHMSMLEWAFKMIALAGLKLTLKIIRYF